ncbi:hypothetical protein A0U40_14025 [[Bacillus] sp. KCTC 13219]|nr:hypothetical protein A0U40_14025 [[Bacillus] sp. KCTC 13219]
MLDLVGDRYGRLVVIKEVERAGNHRRWLCECDCGERMIAYQSNLRKGHTKSCGCLVNDFAQMAKKAFADDLTGQVFGELTALERRDKKRVAWLCQCSCGSKVVVTATNLRSGHTTSCGCKRRIAISKTRAKTEKTMRIDGVAVQALTSKLSSLNTTGVKGVSATRRENGVIKYRAYITVKGKRISLGTYDTLEAAAKVRKAAELEYHAPYIDKLKKKH